MTGRSWGQTWHRGQIPPEDWPATRPGQDHQRGGEDRGHEADVGNTPHSLTASSPALL